MCGALHELQSCSLTSGRSGGVLHVSWTCSQPCGARGAAVHAFGAMRSDTRAATNLKLIGCSVQSAILYDCDAEALSNSIRPSQSYSPTIKWRCCPRLFQFHGFRSVEVLLDTPPKCLKNCPAAKGDSVQISLSRRVSFFMMKPRLCPSQDQSSPVQSRRPLGFGQVLSDQPAASRLEHCELVPVIFKESFSAGGWTIWEDRILPIERMNTKSPFPGVVFPLLEARSWQEAKSNLVTVAFGKDDRIAWCWTLGPPV
ncbi:unnamed protein product [Brassica rapa]|uniref:Uncharacterized protein n=1 Tax=Brassica campestris TaxID=3711 RepID=A0A8D9CR70_BRACM|nr:unnamed protein product [Brassica rapa]